MKRRKNSRTLDKAAKHRIEHEAEGAASGALAGGVVGAGAGPAGVAVGAVMGGIAGAVAGAVLDQEARRREKQDDELDAAIGVSEGDLGAPNLQHPPAKVGTCSVASAGGEPHDDDEPAEGPFQPPEP